jgi:phospholipid-transporting ATPase
MMNSVRARPKKSTLDNYTGNAVITTFCILIAICLLSGILYSFWESTNHDVIIKYMKDKSHPWYYNLFVRMGNWILIFGNFVPISLMLTLETVKFFQGALISIDKGMIAHNDIECRVQSSNLNEELGQIDYVFSDKTGTLTCNEMRFKYLIVGKEVYGKRRGYDGDMPFVKNVDFDDPKVWESKDSQFATDTCKMLKRAIISLGLCHNVVLEHNGDYNASSPDELAFVYFAKLVGCEFKGIDEDSFIILNEFGQETKYKLLDSFEFNSDRKRMTVIMQNDDGNIFMYCKGADSIMMPRFKQSEASNLADTTSHVDEFASVGLRTLLFGMKGLTSSEYGRFKQEYDVWYMIKSGGEE